MTLKFLPEDQDPTLGEFPKESPLPPYSTTALLWEDRPLESKEVSSRENLLEDGGG